MMLQQRESERDTYLACRGENKSATDYSKQMLEKQSDELVQLREKCEEYERREMVCEKKWTDLIKENEFNSQQVVVYRAQVEKQRDTYNCLLEATEQRVINANLVISQNFAESGDFEKKQAADYLSA